MSKLTLEDAKRIIEAAKKKAAEMGIPESIAVCDAGGNLVAFERMDGGIIVGVDIAIDKAYTSAGSGFPTGELGKIAQPGQLAYGVALADRGRIMVFAGGVPVKKGDELVGGVGASGGMAPDDEKIAQAGAEAY